MRKGCNSVSPVGDVSRSPKTASSASRPQLVATVAVIVRVRFISKKDGAESFDGHDVVARRAARSLRETLLYRTYSVRACTVNPCCSQFLLTTSHRESLRPASSYTARLKWRYACGKRLRMHRSHLPNWKERSGTTIATGTTAYQLFPGMQPHLSLFQNLRPGEEPQPWTDPDRLSGKGCRQRCLSGMQAHRRVRRQCTHHALEHDLGFVVEPRGASAAGFDTLRSTSHSHNSPMPDNRSVLNFSHSVVRLVLGQGDRAYDPPSAIPAPPEARFRIRTPDFAPPGGSERSAERVRSRPATHGQSCTRPQDTACAPSRLSQ